MLICYSKDIEVCPGSFPCIDRMPPFDDFHRGLAWLQKRTSSSVRNKEVLRDGSVAVQPGIGRTIVGLLGPRAAEPIQFPNDFRLVLMNSTILSDSHL
jgi:hypothetical protein